MYSSSPFVRLGRLRLVLIIMLALLLAVGFIAYRFATLNWPASRPDWLAATQANNRGIGYMEQFDYTQAAEAFEEAVKLAPGWVPGQVNLGIALLNREKEPYLSQAIDIFRQIIKSDDQNPFGHYCLGIILDYQNKSAEAGPHFERVTQIDPSDPHAWYHLAKTLTSEAEQARVRECYARAVALDPYFSAGIYALAMELRSTDMKRARAMLDEQERLKQNLWDTVTKTRYTEMGRYATVIGATSKEIARSQQPGPLPLFAPMDEFKVRLAEGARWATSQDLGQGAVAELHRKLRERFGGVIVVLDYNRDGNLDLLCLSAVVEAGKVRDLLLRNEGKGQFSDVTAEAGLGHLRPSIGCTVGDFDNDGLPDLLLTGAGSQKLLRNTGKGTFVDVTTEAGLEAVRTVCLGSSMVDLDQDGDLDIVIAQLADTPESALEVVRSPKTHTGPGLAVLLNVGESPATEPSKDPAPLTPRFRLADKPDVLNENGKSLTSVAVTDLDNDHDVDLVVLGDHESPGLILNDRLLRFHRMSIPAELAPPGSWNGVLSLFSREIGRSDLLLIGPGREPVFLLNEWSGVKAERTFRRGATNSPPLIQAQAIDLDLDGLIDVVGLSDKHKPILLHNDGERLGLAQEALGRDADWPIDLIGLAVMDADNDCHLDLIVWSESKGLIMQRNLGNGNNGVRIELLGHRRVEQGGEQSRSNADGVGTVIEVRARDHATALENGTQSAGLGQSRQPLWLGLKRHAQPDVVRLRWPDNVQQAELNLQACTLNSINETNRKTTSCPILFAWNGKRFEFVTDFFGAATMGELGPDGTTRPPRPEESIKLDHHMLALQDGHYVLKIAEPMDEVVYLDRLQLIAVDHRADVRVYPDERFAMGSEQPSQDVLAFKEEIYPLKARDHRGRDVTQTLRSWDRQTVDGFARRKWLGFAEEHFVELDFGRQLARFGPNDQLVLCLAGWTDYAFPESIWASTQAGVAMVPPVLESRVADGSWQPVLTELGLPAGLPRMMTVDVTGKLAGPACVLRIRTNLQVYWDQVFVTPVIERLGLKNLANSGKPTLVINRLDVAEGILANRGCAQEYTPDGKLPTLYNHDRLESVSVSHLSGRLTRLGNVTELLHDRDDRFAIFGPGDEVTIRFDAHSLPSLPAGWKRSFVLHAQGYCKDCGPFTATGATIEPLPFQGMSKYPYGPDEHYPVDNPHDEYRRRFNTRVVGEAVRQR